MTMRPPRPAGPLLCLVAGLVPAAVSAQEGPAFPLPPSSFPAPVEDRMAFPFILLDRLEYRAREGKDAWTWDAQAWYGADYDKLWIRSEGEKESGGRTGQAAVEALYARRFRPFWFFQGGVRVDERPGPRRTSLALGVQGIMPLWFDVQAATYVGRKGEVEARLEVESNLYLTQRLILQPRAEARVATRADEERGLGRGVRGVEAGLRLRYEIRREIAPYVGVQWSRAYGGTADAIRRAGGDPSEPSLVAGVRIWY